MEKDNKHFVLRKYVTATSVEDALRKDHESPVSEVFLDDRQQERTSAVGFSVRLDTEEGSTAPSSQ